LERRTVLARAPPGGTNRKPEHQEWGQVDRREVAKQRVPSALNHGEEFSDVKQGVQRHECRNGDHG